MAERAGAALALAALLSASVSSVSSTARAEDRARDVHVLRRSADEALRTLLRTVPEAEEPRVVGAYVALDPSVTEATALAACDDDGDPVIMVTAAFFELLASVADTAVADVTSPAAGAPGTRSASLDVYPRLPRVEAYAALLAVETSAAIGTSRVRPVAPAPGTFEAPATPTDERLVARLYDAMVDSVVAVELAHLALGDVVCAHPTPTREAADGDWSPAEAEAARQVALLRTRAGSRAHERDVDAEAMAARLMVTAHEPRDGALVVHRFLAEIEARQPHDDRPPPLGYLATHAGSALSFEAFRASWRRTSDALGLSPTATPPAPHARPRPAH